MGRAAGDRCGCRSCEYSDETGATLSEANQTYPRLTGVGITGTTTEMQVLASGLHAVGATTRLDAE